ncbi:MAG: hypothetical protein ACXV5P_06420 [Halobacteriota archaeon]
MTRIIICANEERVNLPRFIALRLVKEGRATLAPAHYMKRSRLRVV